MPDAPADPTGLYRTRVTLADPARRARVDKLGVRVPAEGADWATVLVDGDQLETLARLRFEPQASAELGALGAAHAAEKPWLAEGLRPLLEQAAGVQAQRAAAEATEHAVIASYPCRAAACAQQ